MARFCFGQRNWLEDATVTGGSYTSELPLNNAKTYELGATARTTNNALASSKFTVSLAAVRRWDFFFFVNTNFSNSARIRIRSYDDAGLTVMVDDSGWFAAWSQPYSLDDVDWSDDNFLFGDHTDEEKEGQTWPHVYIPAAAWTARYLTVEIDDTENLDGFVEFGCFGGGTWWQTSINPQYGARFGLEDLSVSDRSESGAKISEIKEKIRLWNLTFDYLPEDEARSKAYELQRFRGTGKPFFIIPNPADAANMQRWSFLGTFRSLYGLGFPFYGHHDTQFDIEELKP